MSRHLGGHNAVVIDIGGWIHYGITPNEGSVEDVDCFLARLTPLCPNLVEPPQGDDDIAPLNHDKEN
jgi:hypothetical protein